jgi:adenosylcobinamide-GDP ribazoletransferase
MSGTMEFYTAALKRAVVYFPLVGGLIGLATSVVLVATGHFFPAIIATIIALAFEASLTGAFHEDAFADTWDALGGGWTRAQVLEIMKDSRLGTYGTLSLILGVGARILATATLLEEDATIAIFVVVAASTVARWSIIMLMVTTPPIESRESQAKDVSGMQTFHTLWRSALWSLPLWIGWIIIQPAIAGLGLLAMLGMLVWYRRKILRRVQGTTGDLLGCGAYLSQLVILISATASRAVHGS